MILLGLAGAGYFADRLWNGKSLQADTQSLPVLRTTHVVQGPGGHGYQYIATRNISWKDARLAATKHKWQGQVGYLATIDSRAEFAFIIGTVFNRQYPDVTYLGGYQSAPGEWRWVTGPDGQMDGGRGRLFWTGYANGRAPDGAFAEWMQTAFQDSGKWGVDKVCCVTLFSYHRPEFSASLGTGDTDEGISGYLVEYGR